MNTTKFLNFLPSPFFDVLISVYNSLQYRKRRAGVYKEWRSERVRLEELDLDSLREFQNKRFVEFVDYARSHSPYYRDVLGGLKINGVEDIKSLPMLEKTTLVAQLNAIRTLDEADALVSFTGGTTGNSMKVLFCYENVQERFAYLDFFRAQFGYELGDRVAWFTGKNLLSNADVRRGRVFKDDFINNIRFFSTFHITKNTVASYIDALSDFSPNYLVGFPSSVVRICKYAEELGIVFKGSIKFFFPTAETVTQEHREVIGRFFGCKLVDQYASSEGAPFIFECKEGKLHIDITSGVFEVLDEDGHDAIEGDLVVTSFTTRGTPLIRYKVGDRIRLSTAEECACGSSFPIAASIEGRKDEYILSPTHGEINLVNICNSTKGIHGIACFQVEQRCLKKLSIKVVATASFNSVEEKKFILALQERLGYEIELQLAVVDEIPVEKSGKFRVIRNYL